MAHADFRHIVEQSADRVGNNFDLKKSGGGMLRRANAVLLLLLLQKDDSRCSRL